MEPSKYQQAIFDWVMNGSGNAVIQAVAGSGKTTTLREAAKLIPQKIKVVAFNKSIAAELQAKMPGNAECSTLHSVGKRAWDIGRPDVNAVRSDIDGDKNKRIFKMLQEKQGALPRWLMPGKVCKLVSFAKAEGLVHEDAANMEGLVPDTQEEWTRIMDHHGVETDERITPALIIDAARRVLKISIQYAPQIIDFDDMLYMPALTRGCTFPRYPWVFVDEAQDLSGLQRIMVVRMVEAGGRLLAVGDRAQAIYGFRGADATSMDKIIAETGAQEFPLSICYRCPTSVIEEAQEIVPQIEARPGAEEGLVEEVVKIDLAKFEAGNLVICRNRAPVVKLAYRLLGAGKKVRILGRSNTALIDFVEMLADPKRGDKITYVDDLLVAVDKKTSRDIERAKKTDDEAAAEAALDRQETIVAIADGSGAETVAELVQHMRDLFDSSAPSHDRVLCGTIHSVKGLEAEHVWFLDRYLIPSRGAKLPWQLVQEENLRYVAITRAMKSLRYVCSEEE